MCKRLKCDLKISIIIPAYNCEKTLAGTMESLLNQNYENIEIILIDDGSTDRTKNVIQTYIKTDNRIHVIFQKNSGPSAARNSGLKIATGALLMFMDADDKMESNVLLHLVHQMQKNKCDMLIAGMRKQYKTAKGKLCEDNFQPSRNIYKTSKEIWEEFISILKSGFLNSLCAKVYKKEIIDLYSIEMDTRLDMGEDLQFNLDYLEHCESLMTIPYISYIYLMQNSYLTTKYRENMYQSRRLSIELLKNHLEMHEININIIYFLYLKLMIAENMQAHEHGIKYKVRMENIRKRYKDKDIIYAINHYQPEKRSEKIILLITKMSIPLAFDLFSWGCVSIKRLLSNRITRISV